MRYAAIARVYAAALLELAVEQDQVPAVVADLERLAALWAESPDFKRLLESPELSATQKRRALERILAEAASPLTLRFLLALMRRHREPLLGNILAMFHRLLDEREQRLRGRLVSARALGAGEHGPHRGRAQPAHGRHRPPGDGHRRRAAGRHGAAPGRSNRGRQPQDAPGQPARPSADGHAGKGMR